MRIYFGKVGWGWKMYGIGYKNKWFLGFSIAIRPHSLGTNPSSMFNDGYIRAVGNTGIEREIA